MEARHRTTRKSGAKGGTGKQVVATVYAPKGGVGKTTIAGNLACRFSLRGLKTLIVDLDFQGNLTMMYGYETEMTPDEAAAAGASRSKMVESHFGSLTPNWPCGRRTLADVVKKPYGENGPHLIPADLTLDRLDTMLTFETFEGKNSEFTIARMLSSPVCKASGWIMVNPAERPKRSRSVEPPAATHSGATRRATRLKVAGASSAVNRRSTLGLLLGQASPLQVETLLLHGLYSGRATAVQTRTLTLGLSRVRAGGKRNAFSDVADELLSPTS
ncbi:cobyrinic acid a,c-diamide synthase [Caballeronia arationis]|uniref:AAA domain-containing protein n=2 Tax=Caballeronia arationis TaxID=1777142 RepID=A0A7Z7IHE0_9BURK|nr:cobyrinic acid a,c-diamide synthase [Caballeronia arationis]SOE91196.1 AAA domain-containing protein [Caballeronia arationis]